MHDTISLSLRGEQRCDAMRTLLVGAVRQRRRRRLRRRFAVAALLLGVVTWLCLPAKSDLPPPPSTNAASASKPTIRVPTPSVQLLGNGPTVLARCAVAASPTRVQFLDDDTLVTQLRSAGRQAAIARWGGSIALPGGVADDWIVEP